jgi:hypothetical protein
MELYKNFAIIFMLILKKGNYEFLSIRSMHTLKCRKQKTKPKD